MSINFNNLQKYLDGFFLKRIKMIIFAVAFLMMGYTVYIWYADIYKAEWSQKQIEEYISKKEKNIIFQKDKFGELVSVYDRRKENFKVNIGNSQDIFNLQK